MDDAHNSVDHCYYFADWSSAGVAVQHWLGLLARWWLAPPDCLNFAALAGLGMSDVNRFVYCARAPQLQESGTSECLTAREDACLDSSMAVLGGQHFLQGGG